MKREKEWKAMRNGGSKCKNVHLAQMVDQKKKKIIELCTIYICYRKK
jgi:hypothetical protein